MTFLKLIVFLSLFKFVLRRQCLYLIRECVMEEEDIHIGFGCKYIWCFESVDLHLPVIHRNSKDVLLICFFDDPECSLNMLVLND